MWESAAFSASFGRQQHRSNVEAGPPKDYYKRALTIDLSRVPLHCVRTTEPERGSGAHFHTFTVFLSTPTSTRCHCLLECGKGLFLC